MKKTSTLLLAIILLFTFYLGDVAANEEIKVKVNGTYLDMEVPPILKNGRTLVPLKAIFDALGASTKWDGLTKTVTAQRGDKSITLQIGNQYPSVNGKHFQIDVPAEIIQGRTLVPTRFIAESLGAKVEWDQATKTVLITLVDEEDDTSTSTLEQVADPLVSKVLRTELEQSTLIANGRDTTFVDIFIRDLNGKIIEDYEGTFRFVSQHGAVVEEYVDIDNGEASAEVRAVRSKEAIEDIITIQLVEGDSRYPEVTKLILNKPIYERITYLPQAELVIEVNKEVLVANGKDQAWISVQITNRVGDIIRDFNGTVEFYSVKGARLSATSMPFRNGEATIEVTSLLSREPIEDVIQIKLDKVDQRFQEHVQTLIGKSFEQPILHLPPMITELSCPDQELDIAFVIDSSGSMKKNDPYHLRISRAQEMILALSPQNTSVVVDFASKGRLLGGPTQDRATVLSALKEIGARGGTNMAAGMEIALGKFNQQSDKPRVMILLTDGKTTNKQSVRTMANQARSKQIKVYTIGLGKSLDEALLQEVAKTTGGKYFHVSSSFEIAAAYAQIIEELHCTAPRQEKENIGESQEELDRFYHERFAFSIDYPSNWVIEPTMREEGLHLFGLKDASILVYASVDSIYKDMQADRMIETATKEAALIKLTRGKEGLEYTAVIPMEGRYVHLIAILPTEIYGQGQRLTNAIDVLDNLVHSINSYPYSIPFVA